VRKIKDNALEYRSRLRVASDSLCCIDGSGDKVRPNSFLERSFLAALGTVCVLLDHLALYRVVSGWKLFGRALGRLDVVQWTVRSRTSSVGYGVSSLVHK